MDKIFTSVPVNETAARVVAKGVNWEPQKKIQVVEQDTPLPIKNPPPNIENVTGVRFGRFVVIGYSKNAGGKWVCRCDCGRYALRRTRAVKNADNSQDRCELCRHLAYVKRADAWLRTGVDQDIRSY